MPDIQSFQACLLSRSLQTCVPRSRDLAMVIARHDSNIVRASIAELLAWLFCRNPKEPIDQNSHFI